MVNRNRAATLYRLEQIAARQQVPLARSTLAEWVGRIGVALQPLVDRLTVLLRERSVLHADETPVAQLDPGAGKTRKAYLWAYRSNDLAPGPPILVFDYQPGQQGAHARNFLDGWHGHLMVDDYAGYKALFAHGVTELACLAHARRKFFDLHAANQSPIAAEALRRIGELYEVERQAQGMDAAGRRQLRTQEARPRLEALRTWLIDTRISYPSMVPLDFLSFSVMHIPLRIGLALSARPAPEHVDRLGKSIVMEHQA